MDSRHSCAGLPRHSRKALPVIPAKAGIHNGAPIIKQPTLYIMASKAKGTLYTNVNQQPEKPDVGTSDLAAWQFGQVA